MPQRPKKPTPAVDRRNHYRIDDDVFLEYRIIQKKQVQELLAGLQDRLTSPSNLVSDLHELGRQTHAQLKSIKKSHPVIARYLGVLDEKISLIAQHVSAFDGSGNGRPNRRVNISAGGLAFYSQMQFSDETLLAISLKLFPSHREIVTYGPVVYCRFEPDVEPGMPYRTAVNFSFMREPDREALTTHILEKQFAAVRAQRQKLTN
jgi:hypothetical protein